MYKLLIVDDEQIEREGMAHFIQWDKYDIQLCGTAWNGADALGKIQKDVPDIVLTDIKMPVMNGIELIQKLSETYRNIVLYCQVMESMSLQARLWNTESGTTY